MILITGASENHSKSLLQLIKSIKLRTKNYYKIIVWDLGLSTQVLSSLEKELVIIKKFNFKEFPDFVDITKNAGHYAWKSICIYETFFEYKEDCFWIDAGCLVTSNLKAVEALIKNQGVYSPVSQGSLIHWTHSTTLQFMKINNEHETRNRSGGVVGFCYESKLARQILGKWKNLSLDKNVIAPQGSSRNNHRQDQSILSCLFSLAKITNNEENLIGISIHNDID